MATFVRTKPNGQALTMQEISPIKATTSFVSKDERFKSRTNHLPGPGSYQPTSKNFRLNNYHIPKDPTNSSDIRKQHMWIWGSTRTSYLNNSRATPVGPGSYNFDSTLIMNGHQTNWGKSERFNNFASSKKYNHAPGPGEYESKQKKPNEGKNCFGSVFNSKSPKSYFEKLGSEPSASPNKNTTLIEDMIQNMNPEIEQAKSLNRSQDHGKGSPKTVKQQSMFASKIPRFRQQKSQNELGPGYYEIQNQLITKSKEKLPKIISVQSEDRSKKILNKKKQLAIPGPGSYNDNLKTIEKSIEQNKKSIVIERQERFNNKIDQHPGPGHYMQSKYIFANQKKNESTQKGSFGSTSHRNQNSPTKDIPFGNYNVEIYDIEYRLKKKQQHLEKLKIMEVTLPAFNTKVKK